MAYHERKIIRDAVVTRLYGATSAGAHVEASRVSSWKTSDLPALGVYTLHEESEQANLEGGLKRTLTVLVEINAALTEQVGDVLDALALQVENAFDADRTLGGIADDLWLSGTSIALSDGQSIPMGLGQMTFEVTYYTPPVR